MTTLESIAPREKLRVYDLVREAGVDVSDWSNYKNGKTSPAANPRYCYEWAYVQPGKLMVLNLWHRTLTEAAGEISHQTNIRRLAEAIEREKGGRRAVVAVRARRMDKALAEGYRTQLPLRVILCGGDASVAMRMDPNSPTPRVKARELDPVPWHIQHYDDTTGDCSLRRGPTDRPFVDQFSTTSVESGRRQRTSLQFNRDPAVRSAALARAGGLCEFCRAPGFETASGGIYLESHHIVPLSEGGKDSPENVIALCPLHHREAHHGTRAMKLRLSFKLIVVRRIAEQAASADGQNAAYPRGG